MKKSALLLGTLLCLGVALPALADQASSSPTNGGSDAGSMLHNTAMFPIKTLGVASGIVVGTPIAVVRQTCVRIREFTGNFADKIGGRKDFPPNLFASFMSVPFGILVGTSEGIYYGGKNAIEHGAEKPFGLDSFSMGDMK